MLTCNRGKHRANPGIHVLLYTCAEAILSPSRKNGFYFPSQELFNYGYWRLEWKISCCRLILETRIAGETLNAEQQRSMVRKTRQESRKQQTRKWKLMEWLTVKGQTPNTYLRVPSCFRCGSKSYKQIQINPQQSNHQGFPISNSTPAFYIAAVPGWCGIYCNLSWVQNGGRSYCRNTYSTSILRKGLSMGRIPVAVLCWSLHHYLIRSRKFTACISTILPLNTMSL